MDTQTHAHTDTHFPYPSPHLAHLFFILRWFVTEDTTLFPFWKIKLGQMAFICEVFRLELLSNNWSFSKCLFWSEIIENCLVILTGLSWCISYCWYCCLIIQKYAVSDYSINQCKKNWQNTRFQKHLIVTALTATNLCMYIFLVSPLY